MNEEKFLLLVKEMNLLFQTICLLEWDSQTFIPEAGYEMRGASKGYVSGLLFEKQTGAEVKAALAHFAEHPEELSEFGQMVLAKVKEEFELNEKIPADQMATFQENLTIAYGDWLKARDSKQFGEFQPILEELVANLRTFIPLWRKDEATPYDVLLNQYEPGLTVAKLDQTFEQLKAGITGIRQRIAEKGTEPTTDFLTRTVTKAQQRKFVEGVAAQLGYDFKAGRLDDTVHPFAMSINRTDVRITTRWNEQFFKTAVFGVIHEAGHGIYEQNIDAKFDYTPLTGGTSMGIHESQSLFNEIIIGSNRAFWQKQYPFFQTCTEGTFDDIDFETFYRSLRRSQANAIRIEADNLTYPLHIIIRYEIEKMIFNEGLAVADLPKVWNDKYEEYLGIRPADDLEGVLQDVHWSGGSFGYFPSYALGYMYAAQLAHAMRKELDFETILASDDYSPIKNWLTEHIHQYGSSKKPNELILAATGEELNPQYLIDFMQELYDDIYQITE